MTTVALLGCGLIAAKRAAALPPTHTVGAVYDIDRTRAEALAATLPSRPAVAASAEQAIEGARLVIIAAYHRDLVPLSSAAVLAGSDVLVEKPGARNATELRGLGDLAAQSGRVVRVGYNHRFHPSVLRARELGAGVENGELLSIRARYGHGGRIGYEREWRMDRDISGGGELLDQGVHLIDLAQCFGGKPSLAFAELRNEFWDAEVEDNAYIALRMERGGLAWLHASWSEWKNLFSFEVTYRNAKLEISGLGGSYGTERLTFYEMLPELGPPRTTSWEWPFPDSSWGLELTDVFAAIEGEPAVGAGIDDALTVLEIVDQAYTCSPVMGRRAASIS